MRSEGTRRFIEQREADLIARGEPVHRSTATERLSEPLGLVRVEDPDPETVTRWRRQGNVLLAEFGIQPRGPSQYELDFYARVRRTPPED